MFMIKKKKKKLNECKSINFILLKWFKKQNKTKPGVCKSTVINRTLVKKHPILPASVLDWRIYWARLCQSFIVKVSYFNTGLWFVCFLEYGHSVSQFEGKKKVHMLWASQFFKSYYSSQQMNKMKISCFS